MSEVKSELIRLPDELNVLAVRVSEKKRDEIKAVLNQIFAGTGAWEKQVDDIEIKGVDDKLSLGLAEFARKNAKQARLNAEKIFDAKREDVQQLKAEYDIEDKLWLKAKQIMQIQFKAIEDKAEWKANYVARIEAEEKLARTNKRAELVAKYADLNMFEFANMSDEAFGNFLAGLKYTYDLRVEASARAEAERKERERIEAERIEKQRLENERLKAEAKKREKIMEEERAKREKERIVEQKRIDAERAASEKKLAEERAKAIAEAERLERQHFAKLKVEKELRDKLQVELEAKEQAEKEAEALRVRADAAKRKEVEDMAKAPLRKQLLAWVEEFSLPKTNIDNLNTQTIIDKFESFKKWAKAEIQNT